MMTFTERFEDLIAPDSKFSHSMKSLFVGGYGSGKSQAITQYLLLDLAQRNHKIAICRKEFSTHNNSTYALFKRLISEYFSNSVISKMGKTTTSFQFTNGSEIIFLGLSNTEKLKSLDNVEKIWIEEASEILEDDYNEVLGRLRTNKVKVILSTNPLSFENWIYKRFFKYEDLSEVKFYQEKSFAHNNIYYNHSTVLDNNFVSVDYINVLKEYEFTDPFRYKVAFFGEFGALGDKVFENITIGDYSKIQGREYFGLTIKSLAPLYSNIYR